MGLLNMDNKGKFTNNIPDTNVTILSSRLFWTIIYCDVGFKISQIR
jgi:hypothetical protein